MGDDAVLYLQYLRETGQTAEAREYESYLRETGQMEAPTPQNSPGQQRDQRILAQPSSTRVGREPNNVSGNGSGSRSPNGTVLSTLLGLGASAAQAIPGMEAVQAGARSVVRRQPYREALSDMRGTTDRIPTGVKLAVQAPAMWAMGRVPLSPAKAGGLFGAASQALSADPMSATERAGRTAVGGAAGGTAGYAVGNIIAPLVRAWTPGIRPPEPDKLVQTLKGRRGRISKKNYREARLEGDAAAPQVPGIQAVLDQPDIKPFADQIRNSRKFANASDATVLAETYKLMGKQQGGNMRRIAQGGFDANAALQADDIGLAKGEMLNAADAVMPAFRRAVQTHARLTGEVKAVGKGVNAAKRVFGMPPGGDRLETHGATALSKGIKKMPKRERANAVSGALGHLRSRTGFQPNAISVGGLLTSIKRPAQLAPFLREAGDEGQMFSDYLVKMGLAGVTTGGR